MEEMPLYSAPLFPGLRAVAIDAVTVLN